MLKSVRLLNNSCLKADEGLAHTLLRATPQIDYRWPARIVRVKII